jgi:hypothetical protein
MQFSDMVTQSVFARVLALIILALVMVAAIIIATYDLLSGISVPQIVTTIIGIGVGTAGTMVGINFGVVLQPAQPTTPAAIPPAGGNANG